ncbi:MAG TPA: hypothetical protein VGY56_04895 [Verrucomicrobiae bacterium]|nr:hypothetical protein [Verrucomicrobiae bacterium]
MRRKTVWPVAKPSEAITFAESGTIISNPKLWGPPPARKPNRYLAVTTLSQNGKVVDEYETTFGIRKIELQAGRAVCEWPAHTHPGCQSA